MITEFSGKSPFLKRPRKAPYRKKHKRWSRRSKLYRSSEPGTCVIRQGTITWRLPKKLLSLNRLRSWRARHGDTKSWEQHLAEAQILQNDLSIGPFTNRRLRLEVMRLAPTERFKLDKTNLFGAVKGLEDALVRLNYLTDDSERWEDGPYVSQGVSDDKKYWTIITLSFPKD